MSKMASAGARMLNAGSDLVKFTDTRFDDFGQINYQGYVSKWATGSRKFQ